MRDQGKSRVAMYAATKEEPAVRNGEISTKTAAHFHEKRLDCETELSPV